MTIQYQTLYGETRNEEFTVRRLLGIGGFSLVYQVSNNVGISFVAKIPKSDDAARVCSIRHEGNILRQIQGNNIVGLIYFHDGTVHDDLPPYLILEWAEDRLINMIGKRYKYSKPKHFPMGELLDMFLQICSGMRLVNETVVHCDLNPSNILLIGNTLKIGDFGVAEPIGQPSSKSEFREHRNWEYVAPEYWEGADGTVEADIYCTGMVFYFAATLKYPYVVSKEGDDETACKEAHTVRVAKNPSDWNDQISSDLSSLILKMIAKKPEDRFHSWDEIMAILNQCAVKNRQNPDPK